MEACRRKQDDASDVVILAQAQFLREVDQETHASEAVCHASKVIGSRGRKGGGSEGI